MGQVIPFPRERTKASLHPVMQSHTGEGPAIPCDCGATMHPPLGVQMLACLVCGKPPPGGVQGSLMEALTDIRDED